MNDIMRDELGAPKVVDRATFQAELDALRVREKAHTREGDAIAAARRRLPMVEVDAATPLTGGRGPVTLLEAFQGRRRQLTATSWAGTCRGTQHTPPSTRSSSGAKSACSTSCAIYGTATASSKPNGRPAAA